MNSGAPASTAPADFSSLGMMLSQSAVRAANCGAEKYFGVYFPAGAADFSLRTIWWTKAAACAGMISKTEPPAAPRARVRRMSRRVMDALAIVTLLLFRDHSSCQDSAIEEGFLPTRSEPSVASVEMTGKNRALRSMSEVAFLGFVEKIVGSAPGERHDRERGILVRVGNQRRAIGDKQIFHVVGLAVAVEHGSFRIGAHARGADFVNDFSARLNSERIVAADRGLRLVLAAESFHD